MKFKIIFIIVGLILAVASFALLEYLHAKGYF